MSREKWKESAGPAGILPNRRDLLLASTAAAAASALAAGGLTETVQAQQPTPAPSGPPNIVYFLVANLGYGELGCYGGGILRGADTKRIDAFATEGMKLLNFAPEAQCTSSRSALMTGRYAIRSGNHTVALAGEEGGLVAWERTRGLPVLDGRDTLRREVAQFQVGDVPAAGAYAAGAEIGVTAYHQPDRRPEGAEGVRPALHAFMDDSALWKNPEGVRRKREA